MRRRPIVGVIGGGGHAVADTSDVYALARDVGRLLAQRGAIVLTGGGAGVMAAAALGASDAGGHSIGILPSAQYTRDTRVERPLVTGMGDGRNHINAFVSDALIALEGEAGTLSEIALGLKVGTPVICIRSWEFLKEHFPALVLTDSAEAAVDSAYDVLGTHHRVGADGTIDAPLKRPSIPDQSALLDELARTVEEWNP